VASFKPLNGLSISIHHNCYITLFELLFRGTQTRHEGRIRAGGVEKNVMFMNETDSQVNENIDVACLEKDHRYPMEYVSMAG
jgi:hypothetical protein